MVAFINVFFPTKLFGKLGWNIVHADEICWTSLRYIIMFNLTWQAIQLLYFDK